MTIKTRVNIGFLSVRLAFGRANQGQEFEDGNTFDEYTKVFAGERESYLIIEEKNAASPYVRRFGDRKRSKNSHQPTQIRTLIRTMYLDVSCKLYYRFLQEHSTSFFHIISENVAHKRESSPFQPFIDDPTSSPSDLLIDQHLLAVFVASFQNDIQGNYIPETHAYPPINTSILKVPPKLRDWRKSNTTINTIALHEPPPHQTTIVSPLLQTTTNAVSSDEEIDVGTFEYDGNALSVKVEYGLSHISILEAVMKE